MDDVLGGSVDRPACGDCRGGIAAPFEFSMAFQPVVDIEAGVVEGYEALVRGPQGQPASDVLGRVTRSNRYAFDQSCRVKAITLASGLGLTAQGGYLSINFIPGAMYRPEHCIGATLAATRRTGFPQDRLVFELTENERIDDFAHLHSIIRTYRENRFRTAFDDFGMGYSGLGMLAAFQPDRVKVDMALVRGIDGDARRGIIMGGIVGICRSLKIELVAEGIETRGEMSALRDLGVRHMQGYLFARPAFERLPVVVF